MAKRRTRRTPRGSLYSAYDYGGYFPPKMTVGERTVRAQVDARGLAKKAQKLDPVLLQGRTIAHTFWGKAFCEHLGRFAALSNRLDRGRSYVRSGSVIHLTIDEGLVRAKVSGSRLYDVEIAMTPTPKKQWAALIRACVGHIGSLVELLAGRFDAATMAKLVAPDGGLLPRPGEMTFNCSCPDGYGGGGRWVCKHVAASMFGVGARLDRSPELLFKLRGVDAGDLLAAVATADVTRGKSRRARETVDVSELSDVFGIELAEESVARPTRARSRVKDREASPVRRAAVKKPVAKKAGGTRNKTEPKTGPTKKVAVSARKKPVKSSKTRR